MNLLNENRKILTDLYFISLGEKEAIKKKLSIAKNPDESILEEFTLVDNLIKSIARVVFP